MPTPTGYSNRTNSYGSQSSYNRQNYSGNVYSGRTSTAYDIPRYYPDSRTVSPVTDKPRQAEVRKAVPKKKSFSRETRRTVAAIGLLFVLCITVLYRYAMILSSNQEIRELEKRYNTLLTDNQTMQAKLDRQLELGEVERYAREELGMMKAESYQKFYIDMNMPDGGIAADSKNGAKSAVSGVPGTLMNAFRVLK